MRRRFHKGIQNFLKHYRANVDSWMLFDNSGSIPRLIAEEKGGKIEVADQERYGEVLKLAETK